MTVTDDIHNVEKEVVIKVVDVEIGGPTVENTYFEVEEDILDTDLIGNLGAEDPDGDQIEYLIVQNDSDLFRITENGEIFLEEGMSLNFEESTAHEIQISVSDGKEVNLAMVQIDVLNVVELFEQPSSFITKWEVKGEGGTISIATNENYNYEYTIDWGDGTVEELTIQDPTHTYDSPGVYTVAIAGGFPAIYMGEILFDETSKKALVSIEQWGDIVWQTMGGAFQGCINMQYNATDVPNLENVANMAAMFTSCTLFDGDLNAWDTQNVVNMGYMFENASSFNGNIEDWDVQNVTTFRYMFNNATSFNQNLGNWNLTEVTDIDGMFNNSGMSPENYSNTLIGWSSQMENIQVSDITLGATGINYLCGDGATARQNLIDQYNWTINDEGPLNPCF